MEHKTGAQIKEEFAKASAQEREALYQLYREDSRVLVQNLIAKYQRQEKALEAEKERIEIMCAYEKKYESYGYICGIDEVGRGPLAGPVVAGAVILPKDCRIMYLNDSKQLSEKKREELFEEIQDKAIAFGLGMASPQKIDAVNILNATYEAMRQAVASLDPQPDLLLNDAVIIPEVVLPQIKIIKGDEKSLSIAAASVLAKVTRDRMMKDYDDIYPEYGFGGHKGYGSAAHMEAIAKYGLTPIHRRSFLSKYI